ncbi:condensation domain-containing protein [Streptomyces sp. NPDC014734]|uniref:non-ribosomal peptide synthetase n=1 Tax=Streptomyces sp. NPDC014734 TaxID=3364886 RepID=UPI0037020ACF
MTTDRYLPLTPAQRRLWALAQLRPGDPFFSIPFAVTVDGPLDTGALRRALDELVRRHPALRTRIVRDASGEPVQRVGAPAPVTVESVEAAGRAEELADAFARTPFDVDGGPLLRVRLLRVDDTAHRLLVGVHHIVFDGASLDVFTTELVALYGAFAQGLPSPLPEPAVDQGAFLTARAERDDRDRGENLRYWTGRLAGAPEVLELPLTGVRPARGGHDGGRRGAVVPHEVVEPLQRLARARRCSLFMVLKAAVDVVLSQYGGTDVLTGMAVSGRDSTDSAGLIGYLTRPVVLRSDLSDDPAFDELLSRVRGDLLDALDHADLPVDEVMDALGVARDPSYHPLYQVMYTHQPAAPVRRAGGAVFRTAELRLPTLKTDLAIDTVETGDGLLVLVDYRTDLFEDATAELLTARLRTVLERIGADPRARVSALLRPTARERARLVGEGDPAAGEPDAEECLHTLVAEQAARTPDAVAVAARGRTWSYRSLDAAAERLAAGLRRRGVGPEVCVGVCAPVSFDLVAAHLAVLRAGGVCVPLDPAAPAFLLRLAVDDLGVDTVLADGVSFSLFDHTRVHVVELDAADAGPDAGAPGTGTPEGHAAPGPRNAAWVLRTSGATGEPRAVVAEHRQLVSRLRWAHQALPAAAFDAVVPLGPPDAPGAVFELFAPLTRGGRVVVPDGSAPGTVYAAPSELPASVPGAAHVLTGGEPLVAARGRAAYDAGARTLHHLYITAETAGPALGGPVPPDGTDPVALGAPASATAYVLDPRGLPVAPGVVGELHIGGPAVTRGYLGMPGATAERFRPDPFATRPGGRLFATGDLARRTPDGRLVFAGRAAEQVRVRGVRVAAADVRAALLAHPAVVRADVLTDSGEAGDRGSSATDGGLAAAIVVRTGTGATADVLRGHLAESLPGYMLPARLEVLDRVPLLPGQRVDRTALMRALGEATARREAAREAAGQPVDEAERLVAEVWERVLGRVVGPEVGFFDAGGNSLLLIRLRDRLRSALGRDIDVIDLFRHSTVRSMAALFAGAADGGPNGAPGTKQVTSGAGSERGRARQAAMGSNVRARGRGRTR